MDLKWMPLSSRQKARLNENGERVWTDEESDIMLGNIHCQDDIRKIMRGRCKNCDFVLEADPEKVASLPAIGNVCNICCFMYRALTTPTLRDVHYFTRLHSEWLKYRDDKGEKGGWRDRMGL
jgi:hypothetical protein